MRVERQKIEDAKRAAVMKEQAEQMKVVRIAQIEKKIKVEMAVQKQAEDILARLERGLDRYIRQPSGNSEQALNLYTDNIRAFVQAKAKASDELNKIKARVAKLEQELSFIVSPPMVKPVVPVVVVEPVPEVVVPAPVVRPTPVPTFEDDGFGDVVPTDLRDLVNENAPPLAPRSPFEASTEVFPDGIADLLEDAEGVAPLREEPFESLLPNDAKDLLSEGGIDAGLADIDDGEFEALKQEAGLFDVMEGNGGRRLASAEQLTTLLFGDANSLAL